MLDFQFGFRSSGSTVVSDGIARGFDRSEATPAVALGISKAFNAGWYASLLHKVEGIVIEAAAL